MQIFHYFIISLKCFCFINIKYLLMKLHKYVYYDILRASKTFNNGQPYCTLYSDIDIDYYNL